MRKQFQGNSVKENKEGLEQGEQVERRIERAREVKREREMDSPRPRKKNERGGEKSATAEGNTVGVVMPGGGFIALHSSFMSVYMSLSEAAWGNGRSSVRANRGTQKSFFKEEAESAIYICNGTAGASCGASPDHAPDVMKILLPPPDSFLGDIFAAFFARASAVVVMVVAAALLPLCCRRRCCCRCRCCCCCCSPRQLMV